MPSANFQAKVLRRIQRPGDYQVYRAALEWDLEDPIVIEKREDLKSERSWGDRLQPYHHQVTNLITFCRRLPVTLIADDVGLGKTISAGLVISELIARSRISKILVVCPKLLGPQWKEELESKFDIPAEIAVGRELLEVEPNETGAVITTYNSARLYLEEIPTDRYQMLVLDEAHKLRNLYGVESPPQVAKKFRAALEARRFRFVLMLTATPIHNRLWDLYSLVDLLTVARGHQNPFGSPGMFARKFIADNREEARHLKLEAKDEFRSIVYGYMSRMRRGDAQLYFPDRVVQMHRVDPTPAELALIQAIAKPIQKLNRLAQISILQALTSSPHALMAQLNNMARKGTVPTELASTVRDIVGSMPNSAKLVGLAALISKLKQENPNRWRLVVFTGRRETQTTIEAYLESEGLRVGLINGDSGQRNQETIARFKKNPPEIRVIVSTEAGSEGVNLQAANVLVNFDLPWNPMIVEQRIGRIQRLASEHASVAIFNVMLRGTFEEYIVGRLMEKLQLASHAIGDIEALLEASGMDEDENDAGSFDEQIRQLVVAALAGKDVAAATRKAEESIESAKKTLEVESATIDDTLGRMDGAEYVGPRSPSLPPVFRSMPPTEFTLAALGFLGATVTRQQDDSYLVEQSGGRLRVKFDDTSSDPRATLCVPGSAYFSRTVDQVIATAIHNVDDADGDVVKKCEEVARDWLRTFDATLKSVEVQSARRRFSGTVVLRVRATVAHDSYERLVDVECSRDQHISQSSRAAVSPLPSVVQDPSALGIDVEAVSQTAAFDEGIQEFARFYFERRDEETRAAGDDERKRKRLEDEFTPRLDMTLVAAKGKVSREVDADVQYRLDSDHVYRNKLTVVPSTRNLIDPPEMSGCALTGKRVPRSCLGICAISKSAVLRHLLISSEISSRQARPEYVVTCSLSGKKVLSDEAAISDATGCLVSLALLSTSVISGKRAEADHMGRCKFTGAEVLRSELAVSDISNKQYRSDEQMRSALSGKTGHRSEFVQCHVTKQALALGEAEKCEVSGHYVAPGVLEKCRATGKRVLPSLLEPCAVSGQRALSSILESCALTGKRVLPSLLEPCAITGKRVLATELRECELTHKRVVPSELERCAVTGKHVVKSMLVTSSISGARLLEEVAVRSVTGKFCLPLEAKTCAWAGKQFHPDDLRVCGLTGLPIRFTYAGANNNPLLQPLSELLDGVRRNAEQPQLWHVIEQRAGIAIGRGKCKVEAAILSPDQRNLAVALEVRSFLGFKVNHGGFVFNIKDEAVLGRSVLGKRGVDGWVQIH
jgi:superfamily II DNA or RNA helicase